MLLDLFELVDNDIWDYVSGCSDLVDERYCVMVECLCVC